jgi:hypothetical protein
MHTPSKRRPRTHGAHAQIFVSPSHQRGRRKDKTGEKIYDVEWSMQQAESVGLSIVGTLASRWPLDMEDKARVAQFFALQHVRGPAFKAWHEADIQPTIDALRSDPVGTTIPRPDLTPAGVMPASRQRRPCPGPPGQLVWAVTIQRPSTRPSWTPNDSHRWMPGPSSPM